MLIADIKGKLTMQEEVSEDFLTSSVFSVLRLLGADALGRFLGKAVNFSDEHRLSLNPEEEAYLFWPWVSTEPKFGHGAEPDLLIFSGDLVVVVEAKNYAEKSGVGFSSFDGDRVLVDQLAREYFVGSEELITRSWDVEGRVFSPREFLLVYLTRDLVMPTTELETSVRCVREVCPDEAEGAKRRLYWLRWKDVTSVLEDARDRLKATDSRRQLVQELMCFLDRRGLVGFGGYGALGTSLDSLGSLAAEPSIFYAREDSAYWASVGAHSQLSRAAAVKHLFYEPQVHKYWEFVDSRPADQPAATIFYGGN